MAESSHRRRRTWMPYQRKDGMDMEQKLDEIMKQIAAMKEQTSWSK